MGKRRKRTRSRAPAMDPQERATNQRAIGMLKRITRRLGRGQQMPFLVVSVEPGRHPTTGEVRALPAILSTRMEQKKSAFLIQALFSHLAEIGAVKPNPGPQEAEKASGVVQGAPDPSGGLDTNLDEPDADVDGE